jgi:hypothetical protein
MKIWFDTEFIEDGKTIDLISIGAVREDGAIFYAQSSEFRFYAASEWVRENVFPGLTNAWFKRNEIRDNFKSFAGPEPEFWAYYADYDWVALCQLFGPMIALPKSWPRYCRDVKQLCDSLGNPALPNKQNLTHNALDDAKWCREAYLFLQDFAKRTQRESE